MTEKKTESCSFTGHRQIESGHKPSIDGLTLRAVEYAYSRGVRKFYTGGALGFDTVAARAVILFRMTNPDCELHLILPCADQSVRWRNEDKEAYEHILSMANSVICLSDEYTPECMKARNAELVKRADMLIAYASRERSGAGQTVRMAQRKGIPVYNLFASCGKESAQGEN